jgi:flagellar biosynthesis protein
MKSTKQAVAVEYGQRQTPVLTAIGSGEVAERIIEEARRRGVYITSDPQLVGLLGQLELDQEIPEQLYAAVAAVLSWAYWLKGMVPGDEKEADPGVQASS